MGWKTSDLHALLGKSAAQPPAKPDPRPARGPNGWERKYADRLEAMKASGEVLWYGYEAVKLRLADRTWYTPDFLVIPKAGPWEMHEVKGHWRDDARVKIKVAAEHFPFVFIVAVLSQGDWKFERIPGGGV